MIPHVGLADGNILQKRHWKYLMSISKVTVEKHESGDIAIINVSGCIEHDGAKSLDDAIGSALRSKCKNIIVDLIDVEYIDHKGWGVLLNRVREIRANGGELKFARMKPELEELFEALDFSSLVQTHPSLEDALADFDK